MREVFSFSGGLWTASFAVNSSNVTSMACWRHAVALGFAAFGALLAIASGGDPAALSIAMGGSLSAALGYWVGALLDRTRRSR
jgi:hypothetical protein